MPAPGAETSEAASNAARELWIDRPGPAASMRVRERSLPPPGRGEVRVMIEAAGVAYADLVMRRGLYAGVRPPVVPGYDFVGRIEQVGSEVSGLAPGQRVAGVTVSGSCASRRNVPAAWLAPAPEQADPASLVAAVLNGVTAFQMLHRLACPAPGEWILVHGAAGGVGSMLLDLARHAGLRAIGTASAAKHAAVEAFGAIPLDYARDDIAARARDISAGGVVAAFDHLGGSRFRRVSMAALRPGGVAVLYGGYDATRGGRLRPLAALDFLRGVRVSSMALFNSGSGIAGYAAPVWRDHRPVPYRADLGRVLGMVASGAISPRIAARLPLEQAAEAHRMLEQRQTTGKIVLIPA